MHCYPRPHVCKVPTTTRVLPARVAPTQQNIIEKTCEYIVPEIYPTHTHNITNHVYKHVKSFPQTYSTSQTIANQQFVVPPGPPRPVPAPPAYGPVGGAPVAGYGPVAGAGLFGRRFR